MTLYGAIKKEARVQNIADTRGNWRKANPILLEGEIGLELVANPNSASGVSYNVKVGDGMTPWNRLPYLAFENTGNTIVQSMTTAEYQAIEHDAYTLYNVFDGNGKITQYLGDVKMSSGEGAAISEASASGAGIVATVAVAEYSEV